MRPWYDDSLDCFRQDQNAFGFTLRTKQWSSFGRISVQAPPDKNEEPLVNKSEQIQSVTDISGTITSGAKSFSVSVQAERLVLVLPSRVHGVDDAVSCLFSTLCRWITVTEANVPPVLGFRFSTLRFRTGLTWICIVSPAVVARDRVFKLMVTSEKCDNR